MWPFCSLDLLLCCVHGRFSTVEGTIDQSELCRLDKTWRHHFPTLLFSYIHEKNRDCKKKHRIAATIMTVVLPLDRTSCLFQSFLSYTHCEVTVKLTFGFVDKISLIQLSRDRGILHFCIMAKNICWEVSVTVELDSPDIVYSKLKSTQFILFISMVV